MSEQVVQAGEGCAWLSMPDIAALAGVRRPVVSNWRRRHPSFPAPIGNRGSGPLFDGREVCDWLISTGRAEREQLEPELHLHTLSRLERAMPGRSLVATCTALICLRFMDDEPLANSGSISEVLARAEAIDSSDDMLLSEVRAIPGDFLWLCKYIDELIEAAWGCAPAFERLLAARERVGAAELSERALDNELSRLVAGLSNAGEFAALNPTMVVGDPNAGPGDLLTAVAQLVGEESAPSFVAAEPDEYLARLIRRRLTVHDIQLFDLDVRVGTALPVEEESIPDVIVTQVAYRPGESRNAADVLQQIDDLSYQLRSSRSAVVLGPAEVLAGAMQAHSPDDTSRERLLRSGMVEAIIRLPGGLVPFRPGYETALWVLTPAYGSKLSQHVLVADVSMQQLTAEIVDQLILDVATWRREGFRPELHRRGLCVQTPVAALVSTGRPITSPIRPDIEQLGQVADETVAKIAVVEKRLQVLATPATESQPVVTNARRVATSRPSTTTVRALIRSGQVRLLRGSRIASEHLIADGQHHVYGVSDGSTVDRLILASHYPSAQLTEPGDVIVTTRPDLSMHLDRRGLSVIAYPARGLRVVEKTGGLTPQVFAALLEAGHGGRRATGAVRSGWKLEDWQLQIPDRESLARLDEVLSAVDQRRSCAKNELDALDELTRLTTVGLTDGAITLRA
ncbi:hypothetical protein [Kribbella sp. VKM Ac-2568]|uniref:hypothetical protein n=1 Tax=Kribbella sp. VKM Ac-2568 TaxID=2512219 RepID=UPI00104F769D|nr:hypothetical protein [Kribbella sp. VKM Ac-2568]TCM51300.1 hypothetical protein EV648_101127 [Kribbella sp. VKM Ac-2568]